MNIPTFDEWFLEQNGSTFDDLYMQDGQVIAAAMRASVRETQACAVKPYSITIKPPRTYRGRKARAHAFRARRRMERYLEAVLQGRWPEIEARVDRAMHDLFLFGCAHVELS